MKKLSILLLVMGLPFFINAQDLLDIIEEEGAATEQVQATFKGSRLILGHSVKTLGAGELEFLISHRFGRINSGAHEFFGLDNAEIRLGLEYGISDKLNIGIGRSSFEKTYDGFLKYRISNQTTGSGSFPFSIVLLNSVAIKTVPRASDVPEIEFNDRLSNATVLLIARKFNEKLSLQLMPSFVHRQLVSLDQKNNLAALGMGGRYKLTPGTALNLEYYYRIDAPDNDYYNSFSIGVDIETGGHVFQLHLTNSIMTLEKSFITETFDDFWDGDIHFGFNISRNFQLGSGKKW